MLSQKNSVCFPTAIGGSCDNPMFVQMCTAIGIESAMTEVGCIVDTNDESIVIGKALACKTVDEGTGEATFKIVAVYENGTVDQNYVGAWSECVNETICEEPSFIGVITDTTLLNQ